jgi:hypothetical protein
MALVRYGTRFESMRDSKVKLFVRFCADMGNRLLRETRNCQPRKNHEHRSETEEKNHRIRVDEWSHRAGSNSGSHQLLGAFSFWRGWLLQPPTETTRNGGDVQSVGRYDDAGIHKPKSQLSMPTSRATDREQLAQFRLRSPFFHPHRNLKRRHWVEEMPQNWRCAAYSGGK